MYALKTVFKIKILSTYRIILYTFEVKFPQLYTDKILPNTKLELGTFSPIKMKIKAIFQADMMIQELDPPFPFPF